MTGVRVRYAGAPTGDLHLGNVRTALFNWLFARHEGGAFVIRVEDTDPELARPELVERSLETLRWLGLDWDEGPDVGGPYAPYRQSERSAYYAEVIAQLERAGAVYRCYCTREEIAARGVTSGYDRFCRQRPNASSGRPYALRFAAPDEDVVVLDLVKGEVRTPAEKMQDFVVARSDGSATFVLANTADDIAMEITHVIRGDDLLAAAASNVLLFRALGAEPPAYVHVPLILGPDRSRLGARHGAVGALAYRDAGYLPEALTNYLALLGWSPGTGEEIMPRDRIVKLFSLEGIQPSPAVFDRGKLDWMNAEYIKALPRPELVERICNFDPAIPRRVVELAVELEMIQTRITTLAEARRALAYLYQRPSIDSEAARAFLGTEEADRVLERAAALLAALEPWSPKAIGEAVMGLVEELGLSRRKGTQILRVAVAGSRVSLPLFESIYIIGRDETLARLRVAQALEGGGASGLV